MTPGATLASHDTLSMLERALQKGVLGFYTHFEATEVIAKHKDHPVPVNVFTLVVAEDRRNELPQPRSFLTNPIHLKGVRDWSFGVVRYTQTISSLLPSLKALEKTGIWNASGKELAVATGTPASTFCPPDALDAVPLNRVLKNNFWNGSHVFEWADAEKDTLDSILVDARQLQELSEKVQKVVPLGLAGLSDRLGNLVVQLPVTVLISKFRPIHSNSLLVSIAWHPDATPRQLHAQCALEFDRSITTYVSSRVAAPSTLLPTPDSNGFHRDVLWDDQNQIILAATGPTAFINSIAMSSRATDPEPRVFVTKEKDGARREHRIQLVCSPVESVIGDTKRDTNGGRTKNRIYQEEISRLTRERRFVQYKPNKVSRDEAHREAIKDLIALIDKFGQSAAWLWDPYLSAHDILKTLFHCKYSGSDLRALTGGKEIGDADSSQPTREDASLPALRQTFGEKQRSEFDVVESNWHGLRLEYRIRCGGAGWKFHDRFLIFPRKDGPALAWSLGTSVNSFGKEHHILQQVDNGQLVMDAFIDLWQQLDRPEHLVWKKP